MSYIALFFISLCLLIFSIPIQLIKKNIITKEFYKNKDFIKYVLFIITLIVLVSVLFLDRFGNLIPNILEYFKPEKIAELRKEDQYIVNLGYFGSFLAGTLGLIFGFLSLLFFIFTFLNQSRKNEISDIENRIFKLIGLLVEIKSQNQLSVVSQNFLEKNKDVSNLKTIKKNLKEQHLEFSNFFRMLYQILKYINQHESIIHNRYYAKELDIQVKSYTNIIRSYLDTNLLTCLAINCYCLEDENGEYNNYKKLLERYEFFEHLPNILPMQFSSYLYYDEKAFGHSTWFKDFNPIRQELVEISNRSNTRDFREVFLLFLAKNNENWINKKVYLKILKENHFNLSITGINNKEIPEKINFEIIKNQKDDSLKITKYPYDIKHHEFTPQILKENNCLTFTYYKPTTSNIFVHLIRIKFSIINTNTLEMELIIDQKELLLPIP